MSEHRADPSPEETLTSPLLASALLAAEVLTGVALVTDQPMVLLTSSCLLCSVYQSLLLHANPSLTISPRSPNHQMTSKCSGETGESK